MRLELNLPGPSPGTIPNKHFQFIKVTEFFPLRIVETDWETKDWSLHCICLLYKEFELTRLVNIENLEGTIFNNLDKVKKSRCCADQLYVGELISGGKLNQKQWVRNLRL